jgi:uncharacterized Tic20 family protein
MDTTITENQKNVASLMHLSTFSKYFFPFGNFLAPLVLWTLNKKKAFADEHGRQALNFQLSILLYSIVISIICVPFIIIYFSEIYQIIKNLESTNGYNTVEAVKNVSTYLFTFTIVAILLFGLFVFELYAVITATMTARKGKLYNYPLSIHFIKSSFASEENKAKTNQSKNEHLS